MGVITQVWSLTQLGTAGVPEEQEDAEDDSARGRTVPVLELPESPRLSRRGTIVLSNPTVADTIPVIVEKSFHRGAAEMGERTGQEASNEDAGSGGYEEDEPADEEDEPADEEEFDQLPSGRALHVGRTGSAVFGEEEGPAVQSPAPKRASLANYELSL